MPELAVTAVGADRPGIVAAVARVLHERGGNLEDSAMTILGGHFAIVLLVATDDDDAEQLREELAQATAGFGLDISVSRADAARHVPNPTHLLSVYGADKPGIVAGVTAALAELGVNITDLETQVIGDEDEPIYAMVVELEAADEPALSGALDRVCDELGVDHTLRTIQAETY